MRRLLPYVVVLLLYSMTPGAAHLASQAALLVTTGQVESTVHDDAEAPEHREHGCTGAFHVCPCHSTVAFTLAHEPAAMASPAAAAAPVVWFVDAAPAEGHVGNIFRPPIA